MNNYTTKIIKQDDEFKAWNEFVLRQGGGYFQSLDYYKFCEQIEEHSPFVIAAFRNEQVVGAVLVVIHTNGKWVKRYFSRRAIIVGGPIVTQGKNELPLMKELLKSLNQFLNKKVIYTEFRNHSEMDGYKEIFSHTGYVFHEHLNIHLNLTNKDDVNKRMSSSKKRQIKKSLKEGAKIIEAPNIHQVKEFYQILVSLYKSKVKKPLPSWEFFKVLFKHSQEKNSIKYLLIEYNNKIIGGILSPIKNDTIYEWYICGAISENRNIYTGVLATWAAIDYGLTHKMKRFNFMGAGKPNEDYGVRDFKLTFGGEVVNYGRFFKPNNPILLFIGQKVITLLKKL